MAKTPNALDQNLKWQHMLARVWTNGNIPSFFLGRQTCTPTLEIKLVVSQKIRTNSTSWLCYIIQLLDIHLKDDLLQGWRDAGNLPLHFSTACTEFPSPSTFPSRDASGLSERTRGPACCQNIAISLSWWHHLPTKNHPHPCQGNSTSQLWEHKWQHIPASVTKTGIILDN